jgi:hypothetical protein
MRRLLFSAAVNVFFVWGALVPATATPLAMSGFNSPNVEATPVEKVGYWRRQYRRYGYPVPYPYYPTAYGYYEPPPYYPPEYGSHAPPPAASGDYSSVDGDDGDYPPPNGDYPPAHGY